MRYPAVITKERKQTLAEFPDCPGCQTYASPGESIQAAAGEALEGWLEATLARRDVPPAPSKRVKGEVLWVPVPAQLAAKVSLRRARSEARLTQAELAKLAGVSQPMIAKLENPDSNPTIETMEKVARALGRRLEIQLTPENGHRAGRT